MVQVPQENGTQYEKSVAAVSTLVRLRDCALLCGRSAAPICAGQRPGERPVVKKDVLRALRQEELDPRSAETWHFRMTFDTAEMFVYQCDESNTMTVYLYVFKTVEQREAASASLLQMGFLMPYPTFYAKNILLYAEFFARESENMAKLERAAVWMGGDITRLDLP